MDPTLYPLDYPALAREALDGGFTQALDGFRPTRGYVVSTRPDAEEIVFVGNGSYGNVLAAELYGYVIDHGHDLRHGYLLGAWRDGDRVVLDLVQVFEDVEDAIHAGLDAKQDAIYDIANGETVRLDPGMQASAFEVVARGHYTEAENDLRLEWLADVDGDYSEE